MIFVAPPYSSIYYGGYIVSTTPAYLQGNYSGVIGYYNYGPGLGYGSYIYYGAHSTGAYYTPGMYGTGGVGYFNYGNGIYYSPSAYYYGLPHL